MSAQCPQCGHDFSHSHASEAQARIADLETQVRLLNSKASSYIDRVADYEDGMRSLQAECTRLQKERDNAVTIASKEHAGRSKEDMPPPPAPEWESATQGFRNTQSLYRLGSLTSYLPLRRKDTTSDLPPVPPLNTTLSQSTPDLSTPTTEYARASSPPPFATDPGRQGQSLTLVGLQSSLETERSLRQQAETTLAQSQTELEELTAQLFGQANEMVATERKARAKLEERVKLLETRDGEKRKRLERLESAVERIERVRRMIVDHETKMGTTAYAQVGVVSSSKVSRTATVR
ncbi:hypothetical protein LTS08_003619 [Lithohypha guttulata]|nr:hypothetical protein LTS08_003619 [Lithohypha guttulata]